MKSLLIGSSSLRSSRLAYGCWRIARSGVPETDLGAGRRAVLAAVDAGYTFFDHADIYCEGRAEAVFGAVLRETPHLRSEMTIATKCGIRFVGDGGPEAPYRYDSSASHIISSCEESLQRLGIEQIDLYQLHRPDMLMDASEVAQAFDELHRSGKVREFGVSNFLPGQVSLLQQATNRPLVVNQIEISLLQLGALENGVLDQCQAERLTPLAWSPLGGGLLADGAVDILPSQQRYQPAGIVGALKKMARVKETSPMVLALAWLLRHPAGIVPIVGSSDPARIRAAASAPNVELSREEWYSLYTCARGEALP